MTAWIRRILPVGAFTRVPFVNGRVDCIPGSPQIHVPSAILRNSVRACFFLARFAVGYATRPPFAVLPALRP